MKNIYFIKYVVKNAIYGFMLVLMLHFVIKVNNTFKTFFILAFSLIHIGWNKTNQNLYSKA